MDRQTTAGHAAKRFRLEGVQYPKNGEVSLPESQFADLERIGLVNRGAAPGPVEHPKPKAKAHRPTRGRKAAAQAKAAATPKSKAGAKPA